MDPEYAGVYHFWTDPKMELYKAMKLKKTSYPGIFHTKPNYVGDLKFFEWLFSVRAQRKEIKQREAEGLLPHGLSQLGGDVRQVGGEFIFSNGKPVFAHRMRHMRDHVEPEEMAFRLGIPPQPLAPILEKEEEKPGEEEPGYFVDENQTGLLIPWYDD